MSLIAQHLFANIIYLLLFWALPFVWKPELDRRTYFKFVALHHGIAILLIWGLWTLQFVDLWA